MVACVASATLKWRGVTAYVAISSSLCNTRGGLSLSAPKSAGPTRRFITKCVRQSAVLLSCPSPPTPVHSKVDYRACSSVSLSCRVSLIWPWSMHILSFTPFTALALAHAYATQQPAQILHVLLLTIIAAKLSNRL